MDRDRDEAYYNFFQKDDHGSDDQVMENPNNPKACFNCKTTKTSLWRSGPAGPKSLCNVCYLRKRKNEKMVLEIKRADARKKGSEHKALQAAETLVLMSSSCSSATGLKL